LAAHLERSNVPVHLRSIIERGAATFTNNDSTVSLAGSPASRYVTRDASTQLVTRAAPSPVVTRSESEEDREEREERERVARLRSTPINREADKKPAPPAPKAAPGALVANSLRAPLAPELLALFRKVSK
jgi:hypothetical protein